MPVLGTAVRGAVVPWALAALLAAALLLATAEVRRSKALVSEQRLDRRTLRIGDFVPQVQLLQHAGPPLEVGAPGRDSVEVVFLLTSSCEYCRASVDAWNELTRSLRASGASARYVAAASDSAEVARNFALENGLIAPLGVFRSSRDAALFRSGIVPQFVIVDSDGRVRYSRLGTLQLGVALDSLVDAVQLLTKAPGDSVR